MTKDQYNKAGLILEQIDKLKALNKRIQKDYDFYKNGTDDGHLLETLRLCREAVDVLKEIDENQFKQL